MRVPRALLDEGSLPTRLLNSRTGLSGRRGKGQFTAAMCELQRTLTVTVARAKSRTLPGYEYVCDLFGRIWPEVIEAASVRYPNRAVAITAIHHRCRAWPLRLAA